MSTWHQDQRPVQLWHPTKWTVVSDPPNMLRTVMRFDTKEEAEGFLARTKDPNTYILNPGT